MNTSAQLYKADVAAMLVLRRMSAMCGRLRVGKDFLHVAGLVGAALDLALGLRMTGSSAHVPHAEDGRQIEPTPADDLEVGEVGLPKLIGSRGLVLELIGRLDDDEGWTGDQIVGLEQPIDGQFRKTLANSMASLVHAVGKANLPKQQACKFSGLVFISNLRGPTIGFLEAYMNLATLIIQLAAGVLGGHAAGNLSKDTSLGPLGNTVAGAIGGGLGGQILSAILGMGGTAATSGLDIGSVVSAFATGGVSGGLMALVIGFLKTRMAS